MAQKAAAATGLYSAAATWDSITNVPTIHASANVNLNSTTGIFTAGFTAPDLVSACTGVMLYVTTVPVNATYVVTLQESTVDTAATVSIAATAFPITGNLIFFKFPTPYVFTTLTANAYRFKITRASATTNAQVAADSGGTLPLFWARDNRTGVPGTTDDAWIVCDNGTGTISVTLDGTQTLGNGGNTTGFAQRTLGNGLTIGPGGLLVADETANVQITMKGNITTGGGGEFRVGTIASPYPSNRTFTFIFNENGVGCNYGLEAYISGKLQLHGRPLTYYYTTFSSGLGTAASPLILTDPVDWEVGDEILVAASSNSATNYNESENKFIITKNSATSYVLSNTSGGVEAALSFTHTGAYVLNIQRNILFKTTVAAERHYLANFNTVAGEVDVDWVRFQEVGSNSGAKFGVGMALLNATATGAFDYCVAYGNGRHGFYCSASLPSTVSQTFTGLIACNATVGGSLGCIGSITFGSNRTFVNCFAVKNAKQGFQASANNVTFTNCVGISNNTAASGGSVGGFIIVNANKITLNNCESHCNHSAGISFESTTMIIAINNYLSGTKGVNNPADISMNIAGVIADVLFINSSFGSANLIVNYLTMVPGSEIRFHGSNGNPNNHSWYTNTGRAQNCGAGLTDTTTRTVGNFAVRLSPQEITNGFVWEFRVGIEANSTAAVFGRIRKNTAFGSDLVTVELFLPGSIVADATQTMGNTVEDWLVFNLAVAYTGSVAGFFAVRITAKTVTASAYAYVADIYDGTNTLTALRAWLNGKPSPVITQLLGDPLAVWAQLESVMLTPGTMGYRVVNTLATLVNQTTILNRLGSFTGTGVNTVLGFFRALMRKDLAAPSDIGGSFDPAMDSVEAISESLVVLDDYVDTEVATLVTNIAAILAEVGAIKAKTDNLTNDPADESNTQAAIASVLAAIAALNNPAAADIVTAIFAGMMEGLTFEEIIKDIWAQVVGDAISNDATNPTQLEYDGPNGVVQVIHNRTATTRTKV